jgi:hypothetical protein|tara:strand:+ start:16311 stop:17309 length:999 start_codon:yes stop_codon:yes gene_type:complete
MDKLLQDAIADAKAVRETALANAKLALEEAFTPHLKSMLSKKLQAETEGEDEESHDESVEVEEAMEDEDEESKDESVEETNEEAVEETMEDEDEEKKDEVYNDEEMEDEGMHDEEMEDEESEMEDEAPEDDEDDDIGEVLKQLEAEMADEDEDHKEEGYHGEEEDEKDESVSEEMEDEDEDMDEEIDLDEIIKALTEEDEEEEEEEKAEEAMVPAAELDEYRQTVQYLKDKLSEVNLLNAKLLYTNKLFRSRNVSEEQKMKVIEQFDRAANVREVKLVFTTFAESIARKPVNESAKRVSKASKPVASTESKKPIIGENTDFKSRMKKLANII